LGVTQNIGFYLEDGGPPLWVTYIGEKETTLHKMNGIKLWCYQKDLRIHIENTKTPIPPSPTLSTQKNLRHFDQG
jgi:hypothetical protein